MRPSAIKEKIPMAIIKINFTHSLIDKTIQLNKLFIFTPIGMCRKGTAYIPVDTLDDW